MKLLETTLLVSALCVTGALAHPANPFVKKHVQSDGSTLSVRTLGDEHYHFMQTADGLLVERDSAGDFFYVGNTLQWLTIPTMRRVPPSSASARVPKTG